MNNIPSFDTLLALYEQFKIKKAIFRLKMCGGNTQTLVSGPRPQADFITTPATARWTASGQKDWPAVAVRRMDRGTTSLSEYDSIQAASEVPDIKLWRPTPNCRQYSIAFRPKILGVYYTDLTSGQGTYLPKSGWLFKHYANDLNTRHYGLEYKFYNTSSVDCRDLYYTCDMWVKVACRHRLSGRVTKHMAAVNPVEGLAADTSTSGPQPHSAPTPEPEDLDAEEIEDTKEIET